MQFDNPGEGSFSLGPHELRVICPRLVSGRDFSAAELTDVGGTVITILVLADGLIVGGLTYLLDPMLTEPARETRNHEERKAEREREKKCCCNPCVDDRCRDECKCCCEECKASHDCAPEPCEDAKQAGPKEHDGEPCDHERERGCYEEAKGRLRRIWVEIDLDSDPK